MTESQLERRRNSLEMVLEDKESQYSIWLVDSFIDIRNQRTQEGVYTDSLQYAKRWILNDIKKNNQRRDTYMKRYIKCAYCGEKIYENEFCLEDRYGRKYKSYECLCKGSFYGQYKSYELEEDRLDDEIFMCD